VYDTRAQHTAAGARDDGDFVLCFRSNHAIRAIKSRRKKKKLIFRLDGNAVIRKVGKKTNAF